MSNNLILPTGIVELLTSNKYINKGYQTGVLSSLNQNPSYKSGSLDRPVFLVKVLKT